MAKSVAEVNVHETWRDGRGRQLVVLDVDGPRVVLGVLGTTKVFERLRKHFQACIGAQNGYRLVRP